MCAQFNQFSPVETLPYMRSYLLKEVNISDLENRLKEIDARIQTWKNICRRERIDITEEEQELNRLKFQAEHVKSSTEGISDHCIQVMILVESEEPICQRIFQKFRQNFKREPEQAKLDALRTSLIKLTAEMVVPWIQIANSEGVDIKDELEALNSANRNSLEKLSEPSFTALHVKEVVQRRLITLRTQCTSRIIRKVHVHQILQLAKKAKSVDWFDDKRTCIIEGIKSEALNSLPESGSLRDLAKECERVFNLYRYNLELYEINPRHYEELADREWLRRNIVFYGEKLTGLAFERGNSHMALDIYNTMRLGLSFLNSDRTTEDIRHSFNQAFDLYAERLSLGYKISSCGSIETAMRKRNPGDDAE
jgi:hypothetical protein